VAVNGRGPVPDEVEQTSVAASHEQHRSTPFDVIAALGEHREPRRAQARVDRLAGGQRVVEPDREADRSLVPDLGLHRYDRGNAVPDERAGDP
jgi:hypothetical protein